MENAAEWGYFKLIFHFIDAEIATFQGNLRYSMGHWMGGLACHPVSGAPDVRVFDIGPPFVGDAEDG